MIAIGPGNADEKASPEQKFKAAGPGDVGEEAAEESSLQRVVDMLEETIPLEAPNKQERLDKVLAELKSIAAMEAEEGEEEEEEEVKEFPTESKEEQI